MAAASRSFLPGKDYSDKTCQEAPSSFTLSTALVLSGRKDLPDILARLFSH